MLYSLDWLRQYVELSADVEVLARCLTEIGMAVEGIERIEGGDVLLDVDVTTNRVDCMNHLGLAREIAARFDQPLRPPTVELPAVDGGAPTTRVDIEARSLCRRYVGRVIRGVDVGPSPEWLARRLESIGLRPINNIVDVTNYVLWELGQPLHAFDLATLSEGRIVVRVARTGECLRTLDGEDRELDPSMLVIADATTPIALAGVMGGEATEVSEQTKDLLIESAWFDPASVRRTARSLGMHSDASHRFERGADPAVSLFAADRAAALILELAGGRLDGDAVDARGEALPEPRPVKISLDRLDSFSGAEIPPGPTEKALTALGFTIEVESAGTWSVTPPSWRRFDVLEEADVFEEAMRYFGFDNIPSSLPQLVGSDAPEPDGHRRRRSVQDHLAASGYAEAVNFAFHGVDDDAQFSPLMSGEGPLLLDNPLSERYTVMRRSLLPGLVASARFNRRRERPSVGLFEIGHVFWVDTLGTPQETGRVAIVTGGRLGSPWQGEQAADFFDLKGAMESLVTAHGRRLTARALDLPGFVAGRCAELVDQAGERFGQLGEVAEEPEAYPLFAGELALSALSSVHDPNVVEVPSRFPGVGVDLTLTHAVATVWSELAEAIETHRCRELVAFELKDRYQGKGVPEGAVNTTFSFLYNAGDRSLTQDEVNERHQALADELRRAFQWGGPDD